MEIREGREIIYTHQDIAEMIGVDPKRVSVELIMGGDKSQGRFRIVVDFRDGVNK